MTDNSPYPALLVQKGWVEKLDKSVLPNIKNLQDTLKHPSWDPNRDYSLPWQSGMTGIGYNAKLTKPVTSIDQLLTDPEAEGEGDDAHRDGRLGRARDARQRRRPRQGHRRLVQPRAPDDPEGASSRARSASSPATTTRRCSPRATSAAALAWSGDVVQLQADNKNLKYTLPKSGGMIWTDNMLIPKGGNAYTASVYMNFVYDPNIAAQIEDYVNYICPVKGADKVLAQDRPGRREEPAHLPAEERCSPSCTPFDPKALFNADYKEKWQQPARRLMPTS